MLVRGILISIALMALLAACSGPDSSPTESREPGVPPTAPGATATAPVIDQPSPTSTTPPSPTPSPTPEPSPTPTPACDIENVAAVVEQFARAFDRAHWAGMEQTLPAKSENAVHMPPAPGRDTTAFLGASITTEQRGGDPLHWESGLATDLIAHLQERHARGERWDVVAASAQPFGESSDWSVAVAADVAIELERSADDLTPRAATARAIVDCAGGRVAYWQMQDDPLPPVEIVSLSLTDIDGLPLRFLSADAHPYFEGYTLVYGALRIDGEGEVVSAALEVLEDGAVVATGVLGLSATEALIGPFDERGAREKAEVGPLFEIDSAQFEALDRDTDGWLTLRVRVTTAAGDEAVRDYDTPVAKLVLYWSENRYLYDEEGRGGNDWVQPTVRDIVAEWPDVQFGDFSDMNGGLYPPHVSHQQGLDVDVWFFGYNELDAAVAETLLTYIDGKDYTPRIDTVFVAYQPVAGDPFHEALVGRKLSDGRDALDVILPEEGHTGHFHVRFFSLLGDPPG